MVRVKENIGNIMMFLGELIVGILLLINPLGFTKTIIIGIGICFTVMGILQIIKYFQTHILDILHEHSLSNGLILTVFGVFCVFWSDWFIATFPVLTVIYGVIILITGLKKVEWMVTALRLKRKYWYVTGINALLTIIFSVVVIGNPFSTITMLWQFTGIMLIIEAIFDVVSIVFGIKEDDVKDDKGKIIEYKDVVEE